MPLPKRLLAVTLLGLLATQAGCESASRAQQRAFLIAGAELQRRAPPPTHDALRAELELFVQRDVERVRERARLQRDKDLDLYRKVFLAGSAIGLLGGTSGTIAKNDALKLGVSGLGIATAIAAFVPWMTRSAEMTRCQELLDSGEKDLRAWARYSLRGSGDPVSREVWEEYVAKTSAIRLQPDCLRVRD